MKRNKIVDNILYLFLLSLGISAGMLLICALIMAAIAYSGDDPTKNLGLFSLVTLILSAALSGAVISRLRGDGGIKFAGLCSIATVLLMLIIALITERGNIPGSAFMNYGCYVAISLLSAYLGRKREKRRRR